MPRLTRWLAGLTALATCCFATVVLTSTRAEAQLYCLPGTTTLPGDPEVLVGITPTAMPTMCGRRAVELQNRGPAPIFCSLYSSAYTRVNRAREVASGASWSVDASDKVGVFCVAATAQVQGAATIFSEVK